MNTRFIIVISLASILLSCNRTEVVENSVKILNPSISATAQDTKASLTTGTRVLWNTVDQIGVYLYDTDSEYDYDPWNSGWTLTSEPGSSSGSFAYSGELDSRVKWGKAAFFPYQGYGSDKNNYYDGNVYFKLPKDYYDYYSGQLLMPMVADLSGDANEKPSSMFLRHVGGSIQVTLKDLPGYADAICMEIPGKKINGDDWGGIDPTNGTASLSATDGSGDASKITLHFATSETKRDFVFNFPVPTVETPSMNFTVWDHSGVEIWTKTAPTQSEDIEAGDILVMPELSGAPQFYLCGYINGTEVPTAGRKSDYASTYASSLSNTFLFVNNTLDYELTQDSYVYLCTRSNKFFRTYAESLPQKYYKYDDISGGDVTKVPAGNYTFTIDYDKDGNVTLSATLKK